MVQPINYMGMFPKRDLGARFLEGLKIGGLLGELSQAEKERALKQQFQVDFKDTFERDPSMDNVNRLLIKYPTFAKTIADFTAQVNQQQKDAEFDQGKDIALALENGNIAVAKKLVQQSREARQNSGLSTKTYDQVFNILSNEENENRGLEAKRVVNMSLAFLDPKKFTEIVEAKEKFEGSPERSYRMLTPLEVKKFDLPPGRYQISPTGKIETVVKEPLVNITGPLVGAENKYAEAVGQASAEEDVGAVKAAIKGAGDLTKINRTLNELKSSQAITGFGAEAFKTIARVKTLLGSKVAAGEVADTELLDALLGSDVFPQIGALGIGARGLDTPAEREFLRMVMTGTINMNRETLIRMTEIRRDLQEESIKQYNERLERGELDRYFEITKRQKKPISLTDEQEQRIQRRRSGVSEARGGPAQGRPGVPLFTPQGAASPTSPAAAPSNIRQEADRIIRGINQ